MSDGLSIDDMLDDIDALRSERDEWQAKANQWCFEMDRAKADRDKAERERDALRASLRDMVEYAEEYTNREDERWGSLCKEQSDKCRVDIAKAQGLLDESRH